MKTRSKIIGIGLVVVMLTVAVLMVTTPLGSLVTGRYTIEGTVTWIDAVHGSASIEFVSPTNHHRVEILSHIPTDCLIQREHQKIQLGDIVPGDRVIVHGRSKHKQLVPLTVQVLPRTTATSIREPESPGASESPVSFGPIAAGPMIQMLEPHGFTLVGQGPTDEILTLEVKKSDGSYTQAFEAKPIRGRYECSIDGLQPATQYDYAVRRTKNSSNESIATGQVQTAPEPGTPFSFMAFGDSGEANEAQYALAKVMEKYPVPLIIHTGDLVYPSGAASEYVRRFYDPYRELLRRSAFYPVAGNHDYDDTLGAPMWAAFVLPRNGPTGSVPEEHYWFDFGDVRFVGINSNRSYETLRDVVAPWLEKVLADAGNRWKVVFFHHPAYAHGKYPPSGKIRTLLVPIFDRYQVDLVLNGHDHMYQRTYPLRQEQVVTRDSAHVSAGNGTVYVVTAAGGSDLYAISTEPVDWMYKQDNTQRSFTIVDVTGNELKVRQIGMDDRMIDEFSIERPATAAPPSEPPP